MDGNFLRSGCWQRFYVKFSIMSERGVWKNCIMSGKGACNMGNSVLKITVWHHETCPWDRFSEWDKSRIASNYTV